MGSVSSVEFSLDPDQKYMYVINEIDEQIDIVDRASGRVLGSFGPPRPPGRRIHACAHDGPRLQRQSLCRRVGGRPPRAEVQIGQQIENGREGRF